MLFDHNVPGPLERFLRTYDLKLADQLGWAKLKNGTLLSEAEKAGFDVLFSGDQTIEYEQNMAGRRIGVIVMSDNHWPIVKHYVSAIAQAIDEVEPGEVRRVYCGTFVPHRFRKPSNRTL